MGGSGSLVMSLDVMMAENETKHMTIASMQTHNAQLSSAVDSLNTEKTILVADIASMQTHNAQLSSTVDSLNKEKTILQTKLDLTESSMQDLQTEKNTVTTSEPSCSGVSNDLAIILIVVVSAMFLITSVTLVFLICKEKRGRPMFAPATVVTGTPAGGMASYGNPTKKV